MRQQRYIYVTRSVESEGVVDGYLCHQKPNFDTCGEDVIFGVRAGKEEGASWEARFGDLSYHTEQLPDHRRCSLCESRANAHRFPPTEIEEQTAGLAWTG